MTNSNIFLNNMTSEWNVNCPKRDKYPLATTNSTFLSMTLTPKSIGYSYHRQHFFKYHHCRSKGNSYSAKNLQSSKSVFNIDLWPNDQTRGPKGHISCTWVQCATFLTDRQGQPSCFSDRPKKHKLGRGRWDLSSCKVSLNSVQRFQRRSQKCLNQSEARAAILFSDRPEKHKLCRGCWHLAFCQVSLNSVKRFQWRSRKCLSQSEARAAILFFRSARKTQTW